MPCLRRCARQADTIPGTLGPPRPASSRPAQPHSPESQDSLSSPFSRAPRDASDAREPPCCCRRSARSLSTDCDRGTPNTLPPVDSLSLSASLVRLWSKKPVVRAFLFRRYARRFGFVAATAFSSGILIVVPRLICCSLASAACCSALRSTSLRVSREVSVNRTHRPLPSAQQQLP